MNIINTEIKASKVLLIDETGKKLGELSIKDALDIAEERLLDLVQMNENKVPVCKLMDYSKFKFQQQKQDRENRKKHKSNEIKWKEFHLGVRIDNHDLQTKAHQVLKAISKGNKVRVTVDFRGREVTHKEVGYAVLDKFKSHLDSALKVSDTKDLGKSLLIEIE